MAALEPVTEADHIIQVILAVDAGLALCVLLIYTLFAKWWESKTGVGVFAMYWAVGLIIAHFTAEATLGQGPAWREILLALLLGGVLIWNGVLIIYKQVTGRNQRKAEAARGVTP